MPNLSNQRIPELFNMPNAVKIPLRPAPQELFPCPFVSISVKKWGASIIFLKKQMGYYIIITLGTILPDPENANSILQIKE